MTFFQHFPKFAPLPLLNFGVDPKFDHIPYVYIIKVELYKAWCSNLFFSKVIEEKPFGGRLDPPGTGRVKLEIISEKSGYQKCS